VFPPGQRPVSFFPNVGILQIQHKFCRGGKTSLSL
jgi:hypothetical protein